MFCFLKRNYKHGFTLIELMLIIAIIGILGLIIISNYENYSKNASCSEVESDAQKIISALSAYFSDSNHKSIPTIDELKSSQKNNLNNIREISYSSKGKVWAVVSIGDDSNQCPNDKENKRYFVYFGTSGTSGWK